MSCENRVLIGVLFAFFAMIVSALLFGCSQNLQQWLDAKDVEKARANGGYKAIIQLNGYPCEHESALRIVRNGFGDTSYHVTCTCPVTGTDTVYDPAVRGGLRTVACPTQPRAYLVTYNPLAPTGSRRAFWVEPAMP